MPRGEHRVVNKPEMASQRDASPSTAPRKNSGWGAALTATKFLARVHLEIKTPASSPVPPSALVRVSSCEPDLVRKASICTVDDETLRALPEVVECSSRPTSDRSSSGSSFSSREEEAYDENRVVRGTRGSISSSTYSRDSTSIYAKHSASIYSGASSLYSSGSSTYSHEGRQAFIAEDSEEVQTPRVSRQQSQPRSRVATPARRESVDPAERERSTLARKAAMYKNSKLPPNLPKYDTSLSKWSLICRAAQISHDCYDSQVLTRRGSYTPADTANEIKAMIVDDQIIDDAQFLIVAIRGSNRTSLTDWVVNKSTEATRPTGFLDDEENGCHTGFLQVTKAMVAQVAAQLQQHPAISKKPSLLITGHSAGGAVAAMLYSHMVSTSVSSDLTALASNFASINCVTFGAPPISQSPLMKRDHVPGIFLAFVNEGDPIPRVGDMAYVKTLARLMTSSAPNAVVTENEAPQVKVVRRSRGSAVVYRHTLPVAPVTPWEDLPLWPVPAAPLVNAGEIILLRDSKEGGHATASRITTDDLNNVIFADLGQHHNNAHKRRIKELALAAMTGRP